VNRSKLPKYFGFAGLTIGLCLMVIWRYVYLYDPFHLPTMEQVAAMPHGYSAPPMFHFLEYLTDILVPGVWLQVFTIDLGDVIGAIMWGLAALINFFVYYGIGMAISAVWGRFGHQGQPSKTS
jgi:hypothetical protein